MPAWLTVVGLGEDGPAGLGETARDAIGGASVLIGGRRHLDLIPDRSGQERIVWPSPFETAIDMVLARRGQPVCILASGDPMLYGIGASLARRIDAAEMRVLPAPSSPSLAAAQLGWPLQDVALVSVTGRPVELLHPHLVPGARILALSADGSSPAKLAALLCQRGFGDSRMIVFEHLGGPRERRIETSAATWGDSAAADLNLVAIECRAAPDAVSWSRLAGLPDEAYRTDGQLTKRDIRAVTLARLAPLPGELLWDVGGGSGSIGIEWMRSHPACRAIAIESEPTRQETITTNAAALGVPGMVVVAGRAPEALAGLEPPDAVFIGGGLTVEGVVETCWSALKPGGRLVANAVTVQTEAAVVSWRERFGGSLTRLSVAQAGALGRFDTWRTALPVTIWVATKP
ncbi:bifunctional cobalt-precorrin-7 (C(5))-methyltransferase/cobalt-precorrin-6B (C(15))-methyltransferase [Magnetospirillum molischianum]|uniref:Precorrin-6Y C(5,15)-methyltransferase n=1 Tax=Magnetospirillum molischianum DSM 120 TaxID=1150626 RepID=H8FQ79_MAGML|nr:bifunctional cobalt-precorrin-7 (C(5))-methyltransferase/cobalt-precorrin-6B (C(15))-methyltransferase [Magnetospirillum molischianum]CCG40517.1 Precorrin-6Y C(5,15)-methyltransferase [Magnetospirillum molischianum DSM 120]